MELQEPTEKASLDSGPNTTDNDIDSKIHDTSACLATLASTLTAAPATLAYVYLAEGNANIIYSLGANPDNLPTSPVHSKCAVLRLRKDLPFTKPCIEVLSAFRTRIKPLFTDQHSALLLEQTLVHLVPEHIEGFNSMLHAMEIDPTTAKENSAIRALGRRGAYHPSFEDELHGILMPNLYAQGGRVLEFKPKWLVQSPSAPVGARRCRTCAVNKSRRMKGRHKGRGDSGFCPFALLSEDEVLDEALATMDKDGDGGKLTMTDFVEKVRPALEHLQGLQRRFGEVGLEDFQNSGVKDFSVAMALRDCSVFLVVDDGGIMNVKLADLDLKTPDGGKVERWAEIEEELISKGLYTDVDDDGSPPCYWTHAS